MSDPRSSITSLEPALAPEVLALQSVDDPSPAPSAWARVSASLDAEVQPHADPFAMPTTPLVEPLVEAFDASQPTRVERRRTWWPRAAGAAAAAVVTWLMLRPSQSLEAGMVSGAMVLTPAMPKAGERVQVRYTAGALLGRPSVLRLRARVRTVSGESYTTGVPVVTLGELRRTSGNEYTGAFELPDSVVFAAIAVEDTAAEHVDDFGERAWEVTRAGADGRPLLDALIQRQRDLMGRSWEAGLETARQLVAIYPDSVRAWGILRQYESWMGLQTDSTTRVHQAVARRLTARDRQRRITGAELEDGFWYARSLDSALSAEWRTRLLRDGPNTGVAVQEELLSIGARLTRGQLDTAGVLVALERLWPRVPAARASQIAEAALEFIGPAATHDADYRRWITRVAAAATTSAERRGAAIRLMRRPGLRREGQDRLRALLAAADRESAPRALEESRETFAARRASERRALLARLGMVLAEDQQWVAARDTLRLATMDGWSNEAFAALGRTLLALGDSTGAVEQFARAVVDPRLSPTVREPLEATARRLTRAMPDTTAWSRQQALARRELVRRTMATAISRHVDDAVLAGVDGRRTSLTALSGARGQVVVFWSPECGPAVEALPELVALRKQLAARALPLAIIAEQRTMTPSLERIVRDSSVTVPIYLDVRGEAATTFNNWGTPMIYVLDARGRVAFRGTSDLSQVLLYAEAVVGGTT